MSAEPQPRRRFKLVPSSIRGRIMAFFVILIAGLAFAAAGTIWVAQQYSETADQQHRHAHIANLLNNVARDGAGGAVYMQFYLASGDEDLLTLSQQRLSASAAALEETAAQLRTDGRTEDAARIDSLIEESQSVAAAWAQATLLGLSGDLEAAEAAIADSLASVQSLADELLVLAESEQQAIDEQADKAQTITDTALYLTIGFGAASVIAAAMTFWVFGRSILRPLESMERSARALGEGDLTARAPANGPAELSAVGEAFNQMTEALLDASRRRELEEEREAAYAALRQSEDRWRQMIQNGQDVITITGRDSIIEYISPAVERLLGYSPDEMIGRPTFDFVHPDDQQTLALRATEMIETNKPATTEFRFRHSDGSWRHLESIATHMDTTDGIRIIVNSRDVTERHEAAEKMEFQAHLLSAVADAVIATDLDARILYWNAAAERIYGWTADEAAGRSLDEVLVSGDERYGPREAIARTATGETFSFEFETKTKAGDWLPVEVSLSPLRDASGRIIGTIGDSHDISERKAAEETIRHMAYHDALTGLPNRLLLKDRFDMAVAQARRSGGFIGVLSLDLDRFKAINDTLGHPSGDELLKLAAERLTTTVRDEDTVARPGGDEFMVLLVALESKEEGLEAAARIVEEFRLPFTIDGSHYHTTASVGIAFYSDDGEDLESISSAADTAMYAAKEAGRDDFRTYVPELESRSAEKLALEADLRRALEKGEIDVFYQPQVAVKTGAIIGVEGLARWHHPSHGLIEPEHFIPSAEETGLIIAIGRHVLRRACTDAVAWEKDGAPPVRLAVNASMREITHNDFADTVAQILEETGFPAERLQLEITETDALRDIGITRMVAGELGQLGVTLAIDDFGAGNTSLRYLSDLPVRTLKIDGGFIQDMIDKPQNSEIAASVVNLARKLSLEVIAEGVETPQQLRFLEDHGCDAYQGFLHSHPQPAARTREVLISAAATVG